MTAVAKSFFVILWSGRLQVAANRILMSLCAICVTYFHKEMPIRECRKDIYINVVDCGFPTLLKPVVEAKDYFKKGPDLKTARI